MNQPPAVIASAARQSMQRWLASMDRHVAVSRVAATEGLRPRDDEDSGFDEQ